jgi:Bacterial protein of unknown function (DUF885)
MHPRLIVLALITAVITGCTSHPSPEAWDGYVQRFLDDYFRANPTFAVYQGKHEYDGRFPDWSVEGIATQVARLHREKDSVAAFDTTSLDAARRFQREYMLAVIDKDLFWLEEARWPMKNPAYYGDALDPNVYVTRPYAPPADRMRAFITYANNIPAAVKNIRATLGTPMPRPYIDIGKLRFAGMASYLQTDVPQAFAEVNDAALRAQFDSARAVAIAAFTGMDAWFDTLRATQTENFAMGPELFTKMLSMTERVDLSLDSVEAMGRADLARNRKALEDACATYAPGATLVACMAKMSAHKPEGNTVDAARGQLAGLRQFIAEHGVASVPGAEQAEVRESPPYQRWNFAYIDIPGPYEHGLPSVYYVAPPDPSWSEKDRLAYIPGLNDLLFTSVHEVWPGHFLQFLHANRSKDVFGRVFVGYAFAEGWAHYAEEMMWEEGLGAGDPEVHIGQLSNALLRNARFLSSIGMQARGMTQAQSEAFFREQGLQDAATASQQAARGTFDPAYLNYTLGKLLIRQLRDDWTRTRGGQQAWKEFHDRFLSYGGPPIPLLRAPLMSGTQ